MEFKHHIRSAETFGIFPADEKEILHIAVGVDNNYIPPMGILLTSLAINNPNLCIVCHVFFNNMDEVNRQRLQELVGSYPQICLKLYVVSMEVFKDFCTTLNYSEATYYRIIAADILFPKVKRILYIDSDMLCVGNIRNLMGQDFTGKTFLAVEDQGIDWHRHIQEAEIETDRYFNAGFLYIDLEKWYQADLSKKLFDLLQTRIFTLLDQDALNMLGSKQVGFIEKKYNCFCILNEDLSEDNLNNKETVIPKDSVILHFAGKTKPWHKWCIDPRKKIYLSYQEKSPWKDWEYQIRNYQENKRLARYLKKQGDFFGMIKYYFRYAVSKCKYMFAKF